MFVTAARRSPRRPVDPAVLAALAERAAPVSASRTQLLGVAAPLRALLPEPGLRRGTTIGITAGPAGGATTLALALLADASAAGSWCVAVGLPDVGLLAADQLDMDLDRVALVPWPGAQWATTVAALLEGVDLVLLSPPRHLRAGLARRLAARLRDQRAVLVVLDSAGHWPEPCDATLRVEAARWVAVGRGEGCVRQRLATVTAVGRRSAARPRRCQLWLPDEDHAVRTG